MHFPNQLPLGFFLSQWMANFILQDLDHSIKQDLKIPHLLRYMDNLTMGADNKKALHKAIVYIKRDGSVTGRQVESMGWLFHRNRTTLARHTLLHISDIARRLHKRKEAKMRFPVKLCRALVSLMGWIKYSDTYDWYLQWVKPFVSIRTLKRIISKTDKEVNKNASGMEKRGVQCFA